MIVGDKSKFAIESEMMKAYWNTHFLGLGKFIIYIGGKKFGVNSMDATTFGAPYSEVIDVLNKQGKHIADFGSNSNSEEVIQDYFRYRWGDNYDKTSEKIKEILHNNCIYWGSVDEAFDDGSNILHFDFQDRVRAIRYKKFDNGMLDKDSISDTMLDSNSYYGVLSEWAMRFINEWEKTKKE